MRVSDEKSISSLQIGFNYVPLKDSKFKNIKAALLKCSLIRRSTISFTRKPYALVSGITKKRLHLSDGVSKWVSEFAIVSNNPVITFRVFTG